MTQLNTETVVPDEFEDYVEVNEAGYDKEVQSINVPQPSPHARPVNLDPKTNGPFLDEVHAVEEENARQGRYISEKTKERAKARFERSKAKRSETEVPKKKAGSAAKKAAK